MVKLKPKSYKIGNGGWNKDQRLSFFYLKLSLVLKNISVILVLRLAILASMHVFGNYIDFLGGRLLEQNLAMLLHMLRLK